MNFFENSNATLTKKTSLDKKDVNMNDAHKNDVFENHLIIPYFKNSGHFIVSWQLNNQFNNSTKKSFLMKEICLKKDNRSKSHDFENPKNLSLKKEELITRKKSPSSKTQKTQNYKISCKALSSKIKPTFFSDSRSKAISNFNRSSS